MDYSCFTVLAILLLAGHGKLLSGVDIGNFGLQKVLIISLYSAPDGSIWAYYHPVDKNQRQLWKRGYCRIEDVKKLSMEVSTG
ncbi:hypothetical protein [Nostoc sp.]|uniref:hypothetical protein n=1 Tax=Nostoc sp. TaxID=1180 RepID=UPI0035940EBE